jgi:glycosyltransferase involved in cell wall biosynthesis
MVSWEFPPHIIGGLGRHVMYLAPALARLGIEVHVLTPQRRGGAAHEVTPEGVHIHRVAPPNVADDDLVAFTHQMNAVLEVAAHTLQHTLGPFDLIHAHDWQVADVGVMLKHAWQIPLIATIHATERGRGQGYIWTRQSEQINHIEWQLTFEAWRVIVCSHFMADQMLQSFHTPSDKIDVIPNGVTIQPSPFASAAERDAFRHQFVEDGDPLVFNVGRVVFEKGVHMLLEAWPAVLAQQPGARLVIAGKGAQLDRLKARAWELGIADQVHFTGYISDEELERLYHVADVAVFPSLYEPFGIVALEAMAAHCPVIVTQTGGLMEVVQMHRTGLTVPPNNPEALTWAILHTTQHPDWTAARVEDAFAEARDTFSWQRVASETAEVYQRTYAAWQHDDWGKVPALAFS